MNGQHTNLYFVLRCFTPSVLNVLSAIGIGTAITGIHLILLSLSYGTIISTSFDGQLSLYYTNYVVQPIETVINAASFNLLTSILAWSLAGFVAYSLVARGIGAYTAWRETEEDTQQPMNTQAPLHPLRRTFWTVAAWRFCVGCTAAAFYIWLIPRIHQLLSVDDQLFTKGYGNGNLLHEGIAFLSWTFIVYITIVLARLYTLRTRLFTDDIVYK